MRIVLLLGVFAALAGATAHADALGPCKAGQLRGSFAAIPGSAGAGNIVYALRLQNVSAATCTLTGLPQLRLLSRTHKPLPTHPMAAHPGQLTAILVRLAPMRWASASARFSPDVPGPGEPAAGKQCEPTASALRVSAPGGGSAVVPVKPPTPVCEHGGLQLSAYVAGTTPPNG
jgi:hypothetical protein